MKTSKNAHKLKIRILNELFVFQINLWRHKAIGYQHRKKATSIAWQGYKYIYIEEIKPLMCLR
jgi:hypothetical protein